MLRYLQQLDPDALAHVRRKSVHLLRTEPALQRYLLRRPLGASEAKFILSPTVSQAFARELAAIKLLFSATKQVPVLG